eukprot:360898_1
MRKTNISCLIITLISGAFIMAWNLDLTYTTLLGLTDKIKFNLNNNNYSVNDNYCEYSDIIEYGTWTDLSSLNISKNYKMFKKSHFKLISPDLINQNYKCPSILNETDSFSSFMCSNNQTLHSLSFEYHLNFSSNINHCTLFHLFDNTKFLTLINNTNLYLIGDSQTWQHYLSLICRLASTHIYTIEYQQDTQNIQCINFIEQYKTMYSDNTWASYNEYNSICMTLKISFKSSGYNVNIVMIRNNFLMVSLYRNDYVYFDQYWNIMLFKYMHENRKNIVIINSGSHFTMTRHTYLLSPAINRLYYLLAIQNIDVDIIYRTSLMGHPECYEHDSLYSDEFIIQYKRKGMPYRWDRLDRFDKIIINGVKHQIYNISNSKLYQLKGNINFFVWNVSDFFRSMSLGHISARDCFHYCQPGPMYWWNVMLYHFLDSFVM